MHIKDPLKPQVLCNVRTSVVEADLSFPQTSRMEIRLLYYHFHSGIEIINQIVKMIIFHSSRHFLFRSWDLKSPHKLKDQISNY